MMVETNFNLVSIYNYSILAYKLIKTSKCVFQIFSKIELEKLWKTRSEVFIQGQKWKNGDIKETWGREEKISNLKQNETIFKLEE
jgi:hypothetical protein